MEFDHTISAVGTKPIRVLRLKEVKHRTGLSIPTIYRRMSDGTFPRSYSLGGTIVGWSEAEIDDWIGAALRR